MSETKTTDTYYDKTCLLLKNYRLLKWNSVLYKEEIEAEFHDEFSNSLNEYLNTLYGAGVSKKYDHLINNHAAGQEISCRVIMFVNAALDFLKQNHEYGELYYNIIFYTYIAKHKLSVFETIDVLCERGYDMSKTKYHYCKRKAIEALSVLLWGAGSDSLEVPDAI